MRKSAGAVSKSVYNVNPYSDDRPQRQRSPRRRGPRKPQPVSDQLVNNQDGDNNNAQLIPDNNQQRKTEASGVKQQQEGVIEGGKVNKAEFDF